MGLSLNTNLNALAAQRSTGRSQNELSSAIARLSSGLRINSARDDAAGMAIADRFTAQIRGTNQASRNANDAISLSQTAESALGSVSEALQRIRELAVQSANATNSASDRAALQQEVAQLVQEVDRVSTQTQFNGISLLDGSFTAKAFQVGANAGQTITVASIDSTRASVLGVYRGVSVTDPPFVASNTLFAYTLQVGSGPVMQLGMVPLDAKVRSDVINNANVPGLRTSANAAVVTGVTSTSSASGAGTATFTINGLAISIAGVNGGAALSGNRAAALTAINARSAVTGVVATDTGSSVTLTAADGRNIALSYSAGTFAGSNAADFGLSSVAMTGGTLNVEYIQPPGVTGNLYFTDGDGPFSYTVTNTGTALSAIDISTVAGASKAITAADVSLTTVNNLRATLGAVQNRFVAAIQNLQSRGENLSAARSRIQDADFAMETANLTRAQVLQEAGTAMIAQANQLPQLVLELLR